MRMEYLTDEELEQLIAHVESHELVAAPPDLMEMILEQTVKEVDKKECHEEKALPIYRDKKKEYRRYCFQVITSMAAAVALVFLLPNLQKTQNIEESREKRIFGASIYESRQEAMEDTGIFMEAFGGFNIFNQTDKLQIFNK